MTVYETDLPGVGRKFEVDLPDGSRLVVVTHNTGRREVFHRPTPDADSEKLFELPDRVARTVGSILEGAYFQPVQTDRVETMLAEGLSIEWYAVDEDSELVGETLESAQVGQRTGTSIVAIQRGDDVISAPGAETTIRAGDTLVAVASPSDCTSLGTLASGEQTGRDNGDE